MAVWNIVVKLETKEVEIENRRHTKENRPEVAMALNAEDPRPYQKIILPLTESKPKDKDKDKP